MNHQDLPRVLSRGSWPETARVAHLLRQETIGGVLLIAAAAIALVAANVGDAYADLRDTVVGPSALHLDLSLGAWAADGLLAVFFFVVGLELKRELVAGDLREPRRAAVPIVAAVGGMVVPAIVYVLVNLGGATHGWAVPTATDIAFALAVLAVLSTHLPSALRTFLLTLAVVDDLLAITIIAVFYTDDLDLIYITAALVPIAVFGVLVQRRVCTPYLLVPLGVVAWALLHQSGVHATIAGVLLGLTVPVRQLAGDSGPGPAERLEHFMRPLSAGFAVPVFAFFSAGVPIGGWSGLTGALGERVTLGIVLGLVAGKTIGILGATWLAARFTHAELDDDLSWWDVVGVGLLGGIGFTVSLLIGELAFGPGSEQLVKIGVITGTVLSAALAAVVLKARNRVYRVIEERETADSDHDGVPDVFQVGESP